MLLWLLHGVVYLLCVAHGLWVINIIMYRFYTRLLYVFISSLRRQLLAQHQLSRVRHILSKKLHYSSGQPRRKGSPTTTLADRSVFLEPGQRSGDCCLCFWKKMWFSGMSLPARSKAKQSFTINFLRNEESPAGGEWGTPPIGVPPPETPPDERALQTAPVPERYRSKKCQEERQYQSKS